MSEKPFHIAHSVLSGETADIYFERSIQILKAKRINPIVTMEVFPSKSGILCGINEVLKLLGNVIPKKSEVWSLCEGDYVERKEVVLRIKAPYLSFGLYETALLGMLSHCTGWATAAKECVEAAKDIPVVSFGARHVHPNVAGVMDYSAVVGGCVSCSTKAGAFLAGVTASGTMPHALIIIMGSTVKATLAFDELISPEVPRIALVDTFKDEVEESLNVANVLMNRLAGVRLDTPYERGRVTADLVKEVRANLDLNDFKKVKIFISGGLDPDRIKYFLESGAPVDSFGVGSYISGAKPIDYTADIHELEGKPVAKRGRIPGITPNPRLKKIQLIKYK